MPWKMFMIEATELCRRSLRRYWLTVPGVTVDHLHDAAVVIDDQFQAGPGNHGRGTLGTEYMGDPRWPKHCRCGYEFVPEDYWQMNEERLYRGAPDGKLYPIRENPPGATWAADWFPDEGPNGRFTGPDGKVWCVIMPAGVEWIIYSYASGEPKRKWDVQGTVPNITVSPSIAQTGYYHGFIKGGVISEDCDGRKFPQWPPTA